MMKLDLPKLFDLEKMSREPKFKNSFFQKDILSVDQFDRQSLSYIFTPRGGNERDGGESGRVRFAAWLHPWPVCFTNRAPAPAHLLSPRWNGWAAM